MDKIDLIFTCMNETDRKNLKRSIKEYKEKGDLRAKSEVIEIVKKCEDDAAVRRFLNEL